MTMTTNYVGVGGGPVSPPPDCSVFGLLYLKERPKNMGKLRVRKWFRDIIMGAIRPGSSFVLLAMDTGYIEQRIP
jgi:hypothetical protein